MRHGIEGQHNPGNVIDPGFGEGSFQQADTEHVVQGAVAPLVDCVALGMIRRSEDLLDPEKAQELGPNGAYELSATVGEESSGGAKVRDDMAHEGFADCVRGVVTERDEDGVLGKTIHKNNQELVAVVGRKRTHSVNGQRIPRALELDGARRLLAVVIIGAQLALGATLSGLQTDAVAGFVVVSVAEKLPQSVATEVGSGVEFMGNFPGFIFILQ